VELFARLRTRLIGLALGPGVQPSSAEELRQVTLLTLLAIATIPACVAFAVIYAVARAYEPAVLTIACAIANFVALVMLRMRVPPVVAGTVSSTATTSLCIGINAYLGGIEGPAMAWLPFMPLIAFVGFGKRSAFVVTAVSIVGLAIVANVSRPALVSPEVIAGLRLATLVSVLLMALPISMSIESARRAAETMLAQAKESAEQTSRVKSELLANVSHELRTPLNAIVGATRQLESTKAPLDAAGAQQVRTAHDAAETLLVLVQDLLDVSRLEAGRLELRPGATDVVALTQGVCALLAARASERGITLSLHAPASAPLVVVDPVRVRQVLTNLVDNAVKFTQRGRVDVTLAIVVASPPETARVTFAVKDTGPGITDEQRAVIFERFRQGDATLTRRHGGSGLGLAIVRELVALMNGTLALESAPGAGAEFTVTLPAAVAPQGRDVHGTRVLLAEDNLVNQRVAMWMLQSLGCVVDLAQDGEEAVRLARERAYDVVLMDCQMPVLDGYAAAARIRAASPRLPIVALTAGEGADDARAREAGMDGILRKPIDEDVLRAELSRARALS
jgi:signal transduction histidine kinase